MIEVRAKTVLPASRAASLDTIGFSAKSRYLEEVRVVKGRRGGAVHRIVSLVAEGRQHQGGGLVTWFHSHQ